ncbi:hypothetical protein RFI_35053 [Reticulomyxa filosa]|uniref:Uncharacterized protein n=1 Tax=Reticulomyxa filosa TaxID=46433 RepID=X6LKE6_RETFI|nr:hypothetical protein RFI_35053 [Reticulomyxa filosa]|eukprot:ETO02383.1 hypothetical protein RFI_35053 [Reticulomyxa filosa]
MRKKNKRKIKRKKKRKKVKEKVMKKSKATAANIFIGAGRYQVKPTFVEFAPILFIERSNIFIFCSVIDEIAVDLLKYGLPSNYVPMKVQNEFGKHKHLKNLISSNVGAYKQLLVWQIIKNVKIRSNAPKNKKWLCVEHICNFGVHVLMEGVVGTNIVQSGGGVSETHAKKTTETGGMRAHIRIFEVWIVHMPIEEVNAPKNEKKIIITIIHR